MYDMTRVNANGYFDSEDSEEARFTNVNAVDKWLEPVTDGQYGILK